MTPTGLSATPDSLTVTAGRTAKIKTTITPDTAPQTVTATTAGTDLIDIEATPTEKNGDLRVQLESGDTAHDWMKPDNTSLVGGGL